MFKKKLNKKVKIYPSNFSNAFIHQSSKLAIRYQNKAQ